MIHNKALLNGLINIEKLELIYFKLNEGATYESELMYPFIGILFNASVFQNMLVAQMKKKFQLKGILLKIQRDFFKGLPITLS